MKRKRFSGERVVAVLKQAEPRWRSGNGGVPAGSGLHVPVEVVGLVKMGKAKTAVADFPLGKATDAC